MHLLTNSKFRIAFLFLLLAYSLLLLRLIVFRGSLGDILSRFPYSDAGMERNYNMANLLPFKTLHYYLSLQEAVETGIENVGGNIILFIPFGFLLAAAFLSLRKPVALVAALFTTSFLFETVQFFTGLGIFDVDDIILNILGGYAGFALFMLLTSQRTAMRWQQR
jgi:glycopeptide antibiotics resistance protein